MRTQTSYDQYGLLKLQELTSKLRSAIANDKDLTREKYQKYYQKCITIRDYLEKEALKALDAGKARQFSEIADNIHEAAAIVDEFKLKQQGTKESPKTADSTPRNKIKNLVDSERWASFSDPNEVWNRDKNDIDNVTTRAFGFTPRRLQRGDDAQDPWGPIDQDRRTIRIKHPTHKQSTIKPSKGSVTSPNDTTITTSTFLRDSIGHNSMEGSIKHTNDHENEYNGNSYDKPRAYETKLPQPSTRDDNDIDPEFQRHSNTNRALDSDLARWKQKDEDTTRNHITKHVSINMATDECDAGLQHRKHTMKERQCLDPIKHPPTKDDVTFESEDKYVEPVTDRDLSLAYAEILEKCLVLPDSFRLGHRLMGKTIEGKIALCREYVRSHSSANELEDAHKMSTQVIKRQNDMVIKVNQLMFTNPQFAELPPEPLWRIRDDGGVSAYIGRYLSKGGSLFDGILFTVHLHLAVVKGSPDVEVTVEVLRKMHGIELKTSIVGDDTDGLHIMERTTTKFTFTCNPETWCYRLPLLVTGIVESDGSNRELAIELPIGPATFLTPHGLGMRNVEHIMKNNTDLGFYTMKRKFIAQKKLEMSTLLSSLEKHFCIRKTNTKHTLMALYNNDQTIVATLQNDGTVFTLKLWSSNEKLVASACNHIKEVAAYLCMESDKKLADLCLRCCKAFPLAFEKSELPSHKMDVSDRATTVSSGAITTINGNVNRAPTKYAHRPIVGASEGGHDTVNK